MTKNVGTIKYTVEAETGSQLTAEKVVNKTTNAMAKDFAKVDKAVTKTNMKIKESSQAVKKGMAGMGRASGQAGIQLQQFVGQIQGGQSAMLALSQQGADMGIVLGAPLVGAIVGIGASLIGFLIPSLGKTKDKFDELSSSANTLTGNFELLTDEQKRLASALLANNLIEQQKELDKTAKSVEELEREFSRTQRKMKDGNLNIINAFVDKDDVKEAREAMLKGQQTLVKQQGELAKTKKSIADLNVESIKQTKLELDKVESVKKIIEVIKIQADTYGSSARAVSLYAAATQGATSEDLIAISTAYDRIDAIKAMDEAEKNRGQLSTKVQGLGQTAEEKIILTFESDLKMLKDAQDQKIEIEGDYEDRRVELRRAAEEKINALNKDSMNSQLISWEQLENQSASALTSIATGAQTGKEAIKSLAQSVLTTMIGSLIKMGIQAVIGQATAAAATSASMAAIAVAAAPAATLVSLATGGANAPLAMAGMAAAGAAAIALSGGRQFGGGVSGGNAYRMGENGTEILKQGNKHIVIPGENGSVVPNNELGGGGVTVNINNIASGVDVQAQPSPDGKTIEIAVRQAVNEMTSQVASGNGRFMNALKSNTNVTTKASR